MSLVKIPFESIEEVIHDGTVGFCLGCGCEAFGVEPDARKYHCDACGKDLVFGAEEIVMMGFVETS
jgi:hypothetical protein